MSYDVNNIIPVTVRIVPAGLGYANFAKALLFAPESELPVGFDVDTRRTYSSITDLAEDFASTTETYKAANRWLGGVPSRGELHVWGTSDLDTTWTDTLNKVRNEFWWYWSFFTSAVYADPALVSEIATWHETAESFFMNCQTGAAATAIRDPNDDTDIASTLTTSGYRHAATFVHATDPYAGIAACKWPASVNYSATNSTITAEFKKLSGVAAEDLTATEYNAQKQDTKKAMWYGTAELQGSVDQGRVFNSFTHSTYGEYFDDVVNLDAFLNRIRVELYNVIANAPTKVPQTPTGQALIIGAARSVCDQFVSNGYLGPRNYTDPDDGQEKFVPGYVILTRPEDILDLSDPDRDARKAAPLRIRIFRAGAVHVVDVSVDVY